MKVILASSSKQRKDILDMIGLKYEVITSLVDEQSNKKDSLKYVEELSKNKANSVKEQIDYNAIIIAADSIICLKDKVYEKPKTKEEAFNNMKEMSGKVTQALTAITILDTYKNQEITLTDIADVKFKNISDEEINWYIDSEEKILNVCGYALLGKAAIFLDSVNGDHNTVFGISPSKIYEALRMLGYSLTDFEFK